MTEKKEAVHIVSMKVENFRRLSAATLKVIPGKGLVRVTGKNASGKTSLLHAIKGALGGGAEVHKESLREGSKAGIISLKLSNGFIIERRFTEKNPKGYLSVTSPDKGQYQQSKLSGWLGDRSFDPLAFYSLSQSEQRNTLFSIAEDTNLSAKLGVLRSNQATTYSARTPVIVKKKELNKVLASPPEGEAPELVDTSETLGKLQKLQEQKITYGALLDQCQGLSNLIASLSESIVVRENAVKSHEERLVKAKESLATKQNAMKEAQSDLKALVDRVNTQEDPAEAIKTTQEYLATAAEVMKSREPWERHERTKLEAGQVKKKEKLLTEELKRLKNEEVKLLGESGIPVPGIGFDEEGNPQLNGLSLAVASGRERIEVAVAVALAADPDIRVCLVDEGNDLDLEAISSLDKLAKEHQFQIWLVRIGLEGDGEIVCEDGVAKEREGELVKA